MVNPDGAMLQPFYAMEILSLAHALEAQGRRVHHLEIGEPGGGAAPEVIAAAHAALDGPQRYTAAKGMPALRRRIARLYDERHGVNVDPERVVVTMGSSSGFILSFLAGFAPGARIAVTRPGYPAYLNILASLDLMPVDIPLSPENGWVLTAEAIAARHAETPFDGLLFASPANPTGATIDAEGFAAIVSTCARLGVRLISDEIYHGLSFSGRDVSALEHTDEAIVVNSFSKYYGMTGWRVGWLMLPPDMVRRAEMMAQSLFISASSLSQSAALAALDATDHCEAEKARYAENRTVLVAGLRALGFMLPSDPPGAFYAYADVSGLTDDSMAFCKAMLEEAGVAATPGADFDRVDGARFVRFSFAGPREDMDGALAGLRHFLKR